jgi:hypothetical protein
MSPDHDYGCDNADGTFQYKYESGLAFTTFLGLKKDSAMRKRARNGLGVYGVKLFDFSRPKGKYEVSEQEAGIDPDVQIEEGVVPSYSEKSVAIFVLDVRSNKTPWKQGLSAFSPDSEGDYLGEEQWQWFESAIKRSKASVNVVVNGLQVLGSRFPNGNIAEDWSKYPRAQQRLFDTLLQDEVQAPILISGDVHMAQLMRKDCVRRDELASTPSRRRSLVEMTTSGMTHSWGTLTNGFIHDPTVLPSWADYYMSLFARTLMRIYHTVLPWNDVMMASYSLSHQTNPYENGGGEGAGKGLQYSLEKNFGELEFDWESSTVAFRVWGEGKDKPPLLMSKMSIDRLSGRAGDMHGSLVSKNDFRKASKLSHEAFESEWVCVNHRGLERSWQYVFGHCTSILLMMFIFPVPLLLPALLLLYKMRRRRNNLRRRHIDTPRAVISLLSQHRHHLPNSVPADALS